MNRVKLVSIILAIMVIAACQAACSFGSSQANPTTPPEPAKQEAAAPTTAPVEVEPTKVPEVPAGPAASSKFPLPPNAKVIQNTDAMAIASVSMGIKDAMDWYRSDAKTKGWTEYELLTTVTDNVFSMAFRVPNQEEELVVQGTVISADNLTLSVRFEETDVK